MKGLKKNNNKINKQNRV